MQDIRPRLEGEGDGCLLHNKHSHSTTQYTSYFLVDFQLVYASRSSPNISSPTRDSVLIKMTCYYSVM